MPATGAGSAAGSAADPAAGAVVPTMVQPNITTTVTLPRHQLKSLNGISDPSKLIQALTGQVVQLQGALAQAGTELSLAKVEMALIKSSNIAICFSGKLGSLILRFIQSMIAIARIAPRVVCFWYSKKNIKKTHRYAIHRQECRDPQSHGGAANRSIGCPNRIKRDASVRKLRGYVG